MTWHPSLIKDRWSMTAFGHCWRNYTKEGNFSNRCWCPLMPPWQNNLKGEKRKSIARSETRIQATHIYIIIRGGYANLMLNITRESLFEIVLRAKTTSVQCINWIASWLQGAAKKMQVFWNLILYDLKF